MPKFYFDISERDGSLTLDTVGAELSSATAARSLASQAVLDLASDHALKEIEFQIGIVVRDEQGDEVCRRFARFSGTDI